MRATKESQFQFSQTSSEENSMLKINFSQTPAEEKWNLHGRLTGPWLHELRTCWRANHRADAERACTVNLDEVTFIDKCGEQLLRRLAKDGAQFTGGGPYIKNVVEHMTVRSKRSISNLFGFLIALLFLAAIEAGCQSRVSSAPPPAPPMVEVTPAIQKD